MNEEKLHEMLGKMVGDLGAAVNGALVITGDRLGLYKALADGGPYSSTELAEQTDTSERYVREWLASQAASGYVEYDPDSERFYMTPEQTMVFANEESPFLMTGGYYSVASVYKDEPKLTKAFRTGDGVAWGDHDGCLFCGVAKFFRPGYQAHLVAEWLPALDGVTEKLEAGAQVADVGCGHGLSTIIMAEAFPNSTFTGFDYHEESIRCARDTAQKAGVTNVRFEVGTAKDYPGTEYDLVTFFDCLHDMGDPAGAASHVRTTLKPDGTWMMVEPFAHDTLQENLNPVGRVYYGFSTAVCTPSALSQEVKNALGAQAGEAKLRKVAEAGGFRSFRRATETPFNLILEARP
ncbi:MAG: methyltransferase domain-containing protein [Candidatus Hydrogenedentes bacterium]|nr:methyltransferase domain-containing protein [Candidatus Hydrogenedentota bacterium]